LLDRRCWLRRRSGLPGGVDLVLIVRRGTTSTIAALPSKLAAGLKTGGRVASSISRRATFRWGLRTLVTADAITAEFDAAGWSLTKQWDELPYQYVLVFTPPAASVGASR
jgi:hypothetical protein